MCFVVPKATFACRFLHFLHTAFCSFVECMRHATLVQVLLRELSRDTLEAVRALFGSTSFPSIPANRLQLLSTLSPNAFGTVQRLRAANMRAAAAANESIPAEAEKQPATSCNSIPWDQTVAHALMVVRCCQRLCSHCKAYTITCLRLPSAQCFPTAECYYTPSPCERILHAGEPWACRGSSYLSGCRNAVARSAHTVACCVSLPHHRCRRRSPSKSSRKCPRQRAASRFSLTTAAGALHTARGGDGSGIC
jgi:hypothetical protein